MKLWLITAISFGVAIYILRKMYLLWLKEQPESDSEWLDRQW